MNISTMEKGIDKVAALCANQKGCDDSFLLGKKELGEICKNLQEIIESTDCPDLYAQAKSFIVRATETRQKINQVEKRLFFAYEELGIIRVDHNMHRFKGLVIRANGKIDALNKALELLNIDDKDKFIAESISLKKFRLNLEELAKITNSKQCKLSAMALNNPWMFKCLILGAAEIKKSQK